MRLSIVSTMYRSEAYLREFHARVRAAARQVTEDYEIVLVNDGSLAAALGLQAEDARVKVVDLSRNFGHHQAMWAGLEHARGDWVFLIDCDLEESPEWLALGARHDGGDNLEHPLSSADEAPVSRDSRAV